MVGFALVKGSTLQLPNKVMRPPLPCLKWVFLVRINHVWLGAPRAVGRHFIFCSVLPSSRLFRTGAGHLDLFPSFNHSASYSVLKIGVLI